MRRLPLLLAVAVLAACGGSSQSEQATDASEPTDPAAAAGGGHTLYRSDPWAVVVRGGQAVALHLVGDAWQPDRSGRVRIDFLGPHGTTTPVTQFAAELKAHSRLVESGLWVDGRELLVKGGGLSPSRGTIYGTTAKPLAKGRHVAVAYARTATAATAVANVFRVR